MKTKIIQNIKSIILALILVLGVSYVSAFSTWVAPTATAPGNNADTPLNVSGTGQIKIGGLTLNCGTNAGCVFNSTSASYGLIVPNGYVGIGTTSPSAKLQVADGTVLFNSGTANHTRIHATGDGYAGAGPLVLSGDPVAGTGWAFVKGIADYNGTPATRFEINGNGGGYFLGDVGIGTTPGYKLDILGSMRLQATTAPTGANGVMYYDSGTNKFRCYQNSAWVDCITSGSGLPAGTEGQMLYNNAGVWTAHSGTYWDDTNNRLGIGTISPKAKLSIGESDDLLNIYRYSDNVLGIQTTLDNQPLGTYGGGNNVLSLQPLVGNVGIGTTSTSPRGKLEVRQDIAGGSLDVWISNQATTWNGGATKARLVFPGYRDADPNYLGFSIDAEHIGKCCGGSNDLVHDVVVKFKQNIWAVGGVVDVMTLRDGNVGIGTTSPGTKLQIGDFTQQNTLKITGVSTANMAPVLSLYRSGLRESVVAQTANGLALAVTGGLANYNDSTIDAAANLFITNAGNVGIGTTSPVSKLHVYGTGAAPSLSSTAEIMDIHASPSQALAIGGDSGGQYSMWLQTKRTTNDGSSWPLALNPVGGNVGIGTTSPGAHLEIRGNSNTDFTAAGIKLTDSNTGRTFLIANRPWGQQSLVISDETAGADRLKIFADGTVETPNDFYAKNVIGKTSLCIGTPPVCKTSWPVFDCKTSWADINGARTGEAECVRLYGSAYHCVDAAGANACMNPGGSWVECCGII